MGIVSCGSRGIICSVVQLFVCLFVCSGVWYRVRVVSRDQGGSNCLGSRSGIARIM